MKKFLLCILIAITFTVVANPSSSFPEDPPVQTESAFCEGWESGFVAGYCYNVYGCVEPLVPLCPLPRVNESSYQDGYNRGFLAGREKKQAE